MRRGRSLLLSLTLFLPGGVMPGQAALPVAAPNDNRTPAGTLQNGVLSVALEATNSMWHPDGDSLPGMAIEVFGEPGKQPVTPGPLVRVRAGTEVRVSVRNSLERDTLTFYLPLRMTDETLRAALDSVVLAPREVREIRMRAVRPGNYLYHANGRKSLDRTLRIRGFLSGAIIVDSAHQTTPPDDRVMVLQTSVDSLTAAGVPDTRREILAINGRSWPHTERLTATVGDTIAWRVINGSPDVHPMHLHGFYFRVDEFDGPQPLPAAKAAGNRMAVTEHMLPFQTMKLTWVPERAGNWLFHCHYQPHAGPHRPLGPVPVRMASTGHESHAQHEMGGLVMGVHVRARSGESTAAPTMARRNLRLVAVRDSGFPEALPSMRFVLEERGQRRSERTGFSPTVNLTRGEPVAITVVNQLGEPLSVHWHGIELESYYDGVAGFAGSATRLAPLIAPADSFEARMTPPRSGTFIYHSHVDEPRHHRAGLVGAIIVRDGAPVAPASEHLFFIKSARGSTGTSPMEINGQVNPDTVVLRRGQVHRFRFVNLAVTSPNATVYLTARPDSSLENLRDTMLVQWRPVAKDGADLPSESRALRPAQQLVSIGETFDFEVQPLVRGELRIEVRPVSAGRLFVRVPVRVE
jgi:FtsP/CotA-like multicopper oxidase with cupredoxin domain